VTCLTDLHSSGGHGVIGSGAFCDQKTSKVLVSHREEFIAGQVGVTGVY
jgi:hypothetical protein